VIDKICFVSVSGGKDSTLTLALALEKYLNTDIPVIAVFADTCWEHPITYSYLNYLESLFKIKIHRVGIEGGIPGLIIKKKIFPCARIRFCTPMCKIIPIYKFYSKFYKTNSFKVAEDWTGMRKEESSTRVDIKDYELKAGEKTRFNQRFNFDIHFKYPIKNLTEREVIAKLKDRNIRLNPLYDKGFNRVGCYPCLLSEKSIRQVVRNYLNGDEVAKERVEQIIEWEKFVNGTVTIRTSIHDIIKEEIRRYKWNKKVYQYSFFKYGD